jgi:hypothetical protein
LNYKTPFAWANEVIHLLIDGIYRFSDFWIALVPVLSFAGPHPETVNTAAKTITRIYFIDPITTSFIHIIHPGLAVLKDKTPQKYLFKR